MTKSVKSKAFKKHIPRKGKTTVSTKPNGQSKYYVVIKGRIPGMYQSWEACQLQVKGFSGAIYKSFKSIDDALTYQSLHMRTNGTLAVASTTTSSAMVPLQLPPMCPPPQQPITGSTSKSKSIGISPCENRNIETNGAVSTSTTTTTTEIPHSTMSNVKVHVERTITTVTTETVVTKTVTTKTIRDDEINHNNNNGDDDALLGSNNNTGECRPTILPSVTTNGGQEPTTITTAVTTLTDTPQTEPPRQVLAIHIQFDGGSRCNPGKIAGAGAVVQINTTTYNDNDNNNGISTNDRNNNTAAPPPPTTTTSITTYHIRQYLGDNIGTTTTNNQAEYSGIVIALRVTLHHIQQQQQQQHTSNINSALIHVQQIHIQGDSQLIINQLNKVYQCKHQQLKVYYNQCQQYIQQLLAYKNYNNNKTTSLSSSTTTTTTTPNTNIYRIFTDDNHNENRILIEHINRHQNKIADALANEAMDQQKSFMTISDNNHQIQYPLPTIL